MSIESPDCDPSDTMSAVLLGDPLTPKKAPTGEEEEFSFLLVDEEENLQVGGRCVICIHKSLLG